MTLSPRGEIDNIVTEHVAGIGRFAVRRAALGLVVALAATGCGASSGAGSTVTVTRTVHATATVASSCGPVLRATNRLALATAHENTTGAKLLMLNGIVSASSYHQARHVEKELSRAYAGCS